jgi:hypothetical protein
VLTDGRKDLISQTIPSWEERAFGHFSDKIILDDSGDRDYRQWLAKEFPSFEVVPSRERRGGYINAMTKLFSIVRECGADYNFHLEDDFTLNAPLNMNDMLGVLDNNKHLAQMSIMRQPWYDIEIRFGGVLQYYVAAGKKIVPKTKNGLQWSEHRLYYTCNPNISPAWVYEREWPRLPYSESKFGKDLFEDPKMWCGIWGKWNMPPITTHTGLYKLGESY